MNADGSFNLVWTLVGIGLLVGFGIFMRWFDHDPRRTGTRPSDPGHWCGACAVGDELERKFTTYRVRMSYLNQPVREALPLEPHERDDELALLEEEWR